MRASWDMDLGFGI